MWFMIRLFFRPFLDLGRDAFNLAALYAFRTIVFFSPPPCGGKRTEFIAASYPVYAIALRFQGAVGVRKRHVSKS
jgi:hypothetical protein